MKQLKINLILCFLLAGCQLNNNGETSNSVSIETFGDSLRIETEVRDSITIKRIIDLKGASDDGFDSSYDVFLTYEERLNKIVNAADYKFDLEGFTFSFNKEDILNFCESRINIVNKGNIDANNHTRNEWAFVKTFENFNDIVDGTTSLLTMHEAEQDYWKVELINHCDFSLVDEKNNEKPKAVLIEHYETSFSGGRNLSIISAQNDTIELLNHNDWMK